MRLLRIVMLAVTALLAVTGAARAADRAIVILDASGSMWAQIDGKPRIVIARETLRAVLGTLPAGLELGLMAYGHRSKGSCADIELLVEPAAGTGAAIAAIADRLSPKGKTPLADSVRMAAEKLRYTEDKATVILITDGLETCNADPCAVASELEKTGVDFTAHVVGFGLSDEEGRKVACLAQNTGGRYIRAGDAAALAAALRETVSIAVAPPKPAPPKPAPPPPSTPAPAAPAFNFQPVAFLAAGGPPLPADSGNVWEIHRAQQDGTRGDYLSTDYNNAFRTNLEPGRYVVLARLGEAMLEQPVLIEPGKVAAPQFVLNAGTLKIRPLAVAGGEPVDSAAVAVALPRGDTTSYGATTIVLPAGEHRLTVTIGAGSVSQAATVVAGRTDTIDIVVGVGRVLANAYYKPGMKVEDGGLAVTIFKPQRKIDGSREQVAYAFGPDSGHDLPAGDYVLVAKMGEAEAETPFSVAVGKAGGADVVLDAGVLAVSAPGAARIEIFQAAKDIQGKRKSVTIAYETAMQTTLKAGSYVVVASRADDAGAQEAAVEVKAGERTETTLALP